MPKKTKIKEKDKVIEEKDHRVDKTSRIATAIASMATGDFVHYSKIARSIGLHPQTFEESINSYDILSDIGFISVRDGSGKLMGVLKNDEADTRKEIRELKKEILDVKNTLDEIKNILEIKKAVKIGEAS